jgi:hypothetical protein
MDVCCASGAPVTSDYKSVGSFVEIGDTKCYVTGQNSDKGIIAIYDIFGFDYPQASCGSRLITYLGKWAWHAVVYASLVSSQLLDHMQFVPIM